MALNKKEFETLVKVCQDIGRDLEEYLSEKGLNIGVDVCEAEKYEREIYTHTVVNIIVLTQLRLDGEK